MRPCLSRRFRSRDPAAGFTVAVSQTRRHIDGLVDLKLQLLNVDPLGRYRASLRSRALLAGAHTTWGGKQTCFLRGAKRTSCKHQISTAGTSWVSQWAADDRQIQDWVPGLYGIRTDEGWWSACLISATLLTYEFGEARRRRWRPYVAPDGRQVDDDSRPAPFSSRSRPDVTLQAGGKRFRRSRSEPWRRGGARVRLSRLGSIDLFYGAPGPYLITGGSVVERSEHEGR